MVQISQPQAVEVHLQQDQELLVQTQAELEAEEVLLQTLFLALRHQVTVHLVQHLTQELFLEAVEVQELLPHVLVVRVAGQRRALQCNEVVEVRLVGEVVR